MRRKIKEFVEKYYENDYQFDQGGFVEIIEELTKELTTRKDINIIEINNILTSTMDRYRKGDYYYVIEIFEYEIVPFLKKTV